MENVTKALLIAAGILFAVLILSLLAMFGGQLSGYYAEQHNSKIIEQDPSLIFSEILDFTGESCWE